MRARTPRPHGDGRPRRGPAVASDRWRRPVRRRSGLRPRGAPATGHRRSPVRRSAGLSVCRCRPSSTDRFYYRLLGLIAEMAVSFAGRPRLASSNAIKVVPELLESSRRVPVLWSPVFGGSLVLAPPPAILHQLQPLEVCFEGEAESGRRMIA